MLSNRIIRMSNNREATIEAIGRAVQAYQDATDAFDATACEMLGINRTDLKCLSIIAQNNRIAVGQIGKAAGLTRGAMTTALDRIERAGYAHRVRHPEDRRGVLVELTDKAKRAIDAIWGEYARRGESFFADYSDADLGAVLRYLEEGEAAQHANRQRVRKLKIR